MPEHRGVSYGTWGIRTCWICTCVRVQVRLYQQLKWGSSLRGSYVQGSPTGETAIQEQLLGRLSEPSWWNNPHCTEVYTREPLSCLADYPLLQTLHCLNLRPWNYSSLAIALSGCQIQYNIFPLTYISTQPKTKPCVCCNIHASVYNVIYMQVYTSQNFMNVFEISVLYNKLYVEHVKNSYPNYTKHKLLHKVTTLCILKW